MPVKNLTRADLLGLQIRLRDWLVADAQRKRNRYAGDIPTVRSAGEAEAFALELEDAIGSLRVGRLDPPPVPFRCSPADLEYGPDEPGERDDGIPF